MVSIASITKTAVSVFILAKVDLRHHSDSNKAGSILGSSVVHHRQPETQHRCCALFSLLVIC